MTHNERGSDATRAVLNEITFRARPFRPIPARPSHPTVRLFDVQRLRNARRGRRALIDRQVRRPRVRHTLINSSRDDRSIHRRLVPAPSTKAQICANFKRTLRAADKIILFFSYLFRRRTFGYTSHRSISLSLLPRDL